MSQVTPETLLVIISEILKHLKIPYAVTGGFALTVWAKPRYTADIDIIIELSDKNIRPLAKELLAIDKDVYAPEDAMREALECHGEFNFIHPQTGIKVDFFVQDNAPYNKLKIKRAILKEINKQTIPFVSPEDLILSKLNWSKESESYKQREDIKSILRNSTISFNMKYLRLWASKQDTLEMLEQLISQAKSEP